MTYPLEDLALVASNNSLDMVLDDRFKSCFVVDVLDPLWELGVPD